MLYFALYEERKSSFEQFQSDSTYLARLFSWFLNHFGERFDLEKQMILFVSPDTIPWACKNLFGINNSSDDILLHVYDPFNTKNNTAQKAFRIKDIFECFKKAFNRITVEYYKIYTSSSISEKGLLSKVIE